MAGISPDLIPNGPFAVGQIFPVSNTTGRLVVVGAFTDGAQQVILDRTFY